MTTSDGDLRRQTKALSAAAEMLRASLNDAPSPPARREEVTSLAESTRHPQRAVARSRNTATAIADDLPAMVRVVDGLSDRLVANASAQVEALRRLTGLRRVNQEMQDCFHALERELPGDANRADLIFADEPLADEAGTPLEWNSVGLMQVVPVSSEGVSAIQLRFRDIWRGENAILHVHLTGLEDQRVVDRWTVPMQRLEEGWTTFSLNRAIVGAPKSLEMRVSLEGGQDARVTLCNGGPQPLRQFQLRRCTPSAAPRPHGMAMRVWCGSAHAAQAIGRNYIVADASRKFSAHLVDTPLAPLLLERATHEDPGEAKFEFPPVKSVPNQVAIEVHPPAKGITIAQIPLSSAARPYAVSVQAYIQNPKSKQIEFAMVLAENIDRARGILEGSLMTAPDEAFSGWIAASAESGSVLTAEIARPQRKRSRLFVATRMQAAGDNFFAWARLRNIVLRVAAS